MKDQTKVEYEKIEFPNVEERLFRALSLLISEEDLVERLDNNSKKN